MVINEVYADGYKNLSGVNITLDERMNIFCGDNAQGKTNLIEAVWLCSGCRSFRGSREKEFIGFEKDFADVRMKFTDSFRSQEIRFAAKKGNIKEKLVTLNGVKLPLMSKLFGSFKCVVFTPDDLDLSKGSPDNRRNFTDLSISQIKGSYVSALNTYNNVLSQRNALLKNYGRSGGDVSSLEIWDKQLAKAGAYISVLRNTYCNKLNLYTKSLYNTIASGKEQLELYYQSTVFRELDGKNDYEGELTEIYENTLKKSLDDDIRAGFTTVGVHRDDVIAEIDGQPARYLGSQGQSRSIAIVMKLAQAEILKSEKGEYPVMLLDDVMSELDLGRQRFILNSIENMQVLITCCDERFISEMTGGKVFLVKKGCVSEKKAGG
ncbi:MAG: DNA replication/repair protein RecF [Oscillospiraceae bacterium]|nr:DNA replication/repair protein RecF [Oscillospiraceae bacterium]